MEHASRVLYIPPRQVYNLTDSKVQRVKQRHLPRHAGLGGSEVRERTIAPPERDGKSLGEVMGRLSLRDN